MRRKGGLVYLVGAGPGDPRLLTLRGKECIERADVVIYDRLISNRLLNYAREDAELIYVGKDPHGDSLKQDEINRLLVVHAKQGKVVTRLKGGDPCVFGRVGEEAQTLAEHQIAFEIVPGISSAVAVPAYAGIPVTHRGLSASFTVFTGHEDPTKPVSNLNWERLAGASGTLVILMGIQRLEFIIENLLSHGKANDTPVALIRYGTRAEQMTLVGTLQTIVSQALSVKFKSPAIIIVGEVVRLREQLNWFEKLPLFGKRILVTRARAGASDFARRIEELGGTPIEFPVIETRPPKDREPLIDSVRRISEYDWVIFTSAVGVESFLKEMKRMRQDVRAIRGRILAVGPKTAEALENFGLFPEELPAEFHAEGIIDTYRKQFITGQTVLLPRADIARSALPDFLKEVGCRVDAVDAYETAAVNEGSREIVELLRSSQIDAVTFTASSTVRNFAKAVGETDLQTLLEGVAVACMGPITAETARDYGLQVAVTASTSTLEGLLEDLIIYLQQEAIQYDAN